MFLESILSVSAISFQERMVEFGGYFTAETHDHYSVIVNDSS